MADEIKNLGEQLEKKKSVMGRPRIEIDWKQFDKLCLWQCTLQEFASWFDCSESTIENKVKETWSMTFSEYWTLKAGRGRASLRGKQFETAMKGNVTMQIWLGKQTLNQKEKLESTTEDKRMPDLSNLTTDQIAALLRGENPDTNDNDEQLPNETFELFDERKELQQSQAETKVRPEGIGEESPGDGTVQA